MYLYIELYIYLLNHALEPIWYICELQGPKFPSFISNKTTVE